MMKKIAVNANLFLSRWKAGGSHLTSGRRRSLASGSSVIHRGHENAACRFRSGELPEAEAPVAVLSGGNIDPELLARVLSSAT
jgi:hypothetical protein